MNGEPSPPSGHAIDFPQTVLRIPAGELRGRLTRGGRDAEGVRIRLLGLFEPACVALMRSDSEGAFRIAYLPAGCYELTVGRESPMRIRLGAGARVDLGILDLLPMSA